MVQYETGNFSKALWCFRTQQPRCLAACISNSTSHLRLHSLHCFLGIFSSRWGFSLHYQDPLVNMMCYLLLPTEEPHHASQSSFLSQILLLWIYLERVCLQRREEFTPTSRCKWASAPPKLLPKLSDHTKTFSYAPLLPLHPMLVPGS